MIHTLGWNWFCQSHQMNPSHQMTNLLCEVCNFSPET